MTNLTRPNAALAEQKHLVWAAAALVLGLALGLFFAWIVWPVEWTDGAISDLRESDKQDYVRMVASSYALDLNTERAAERIRALGPDAADLLAGTVEASQGDDRVRVEQLRQVLVLTNLLEPSAPVEDEATVLDQVRPFLLICSLLTLLLVAAAVAWWAYSSGMLTRMRAARPAAASSLRSSSPAPMANYQTMPTSASPTGNQPVSQFMTTYVLGDDLYDDSFSIDAPDGSFLGECGMGISETIGVGDPKKVTAFEVWLFDKNDIRTVTKVLMSDHSFADDALRSRLSAKGEPVRLQPGDVVSMETASLVVTARVVDMAYGGGALPPNSYFERLTIELAAFNKAGAPAGR